MKMAQVYPERVKAYKLLFSHLKSVACCNSWVLWSSLGAGMFTCVSSYIDKDSQGDSLLSCSQPWGRGVAGILGSMCGAVTTVAPRSILYTGLMDELRSPPLFWCLTRPCITGPFFWTLLHGHSMSLDIKRTWGSTSPLARNRPLEAAMQSG